MGSKQTCTGPEGFVRGGQTLTIFIFLDDEGDIESKYHYKWAVIGMPAKRHLNGASLACRW